MSQTPSADEGLEVDALFEELKLIDEFVPALRAAVLRTLAVERAIMGDIRTRPKTRAPHSGSSTPKGSNSRTCHRGWRPTTLGQTVCRVSQLNSRSLIRRTSEYEATRRRASSITSGHKGSTRLSRSAPATSARSSVR